MNIELGSQSKKEIRRQKFADGTYPRTQVPLMRILREDQSGKEGPDDSGQTNLFSSNTQTQADAQGYYQLRMAGGHSPQTGMNMADEPRRNQDHEKGKTGGLNRQH